MCHRCQKVRALSRILLIKHRKIKFKHLSSPATSPPARRRSKKKHTHKTTRRDDSTTMMKTTTALTQQPAWDSRSARTDTLRAPRAIDRRHRTVDCRVVASVIKLCWPIIVQQLNRRTWAHLLRDSQRYPRCWPPESTAIRFVGAAVLLEAGFYEKMWVYYVIHHDNCNNSEAQLTLFSPYFTSSHPYR